MLEIEEKSEISRQEKERNYQNDRDYIGNS
jgi:hypothetical protein